LALFSGTLSSLAQQNQKTKTSKFVYATHFGFSTGIGTLAFDERHWDNSLNLFKIQQFLAYQFNNYITFGISGGIDIWKKTAFIPLSLSLNVNFIDRKLVPFWFLNTGYSFKWYGSQRPDAMQRVIYGSTAGLYGETGIGMKINMNEKIAFLISANYTVQQSSIKYSREGTEGSFSLLYTNSQQRMLYHFLGLKLGILY
jgi:hypothetical protein